MESVFEFSGSNIKTIRTMAASALAAITAFEVKLFREHDVSLFGVVVVFSFYFFSYSHGQ